MRSLSHVILARDKAYFIQSSIAHGSQASLCECSCVHMVKRDDIQEREEIVENGRCSGPSVTSNNKRDSCNRQLSTHTNAHTHTQATNAVAEMVRASGADVRAAAKSRSQMKEKDLMTTKRAFTSRRRGEFALSGPPVLVSRFLLCGVARTGSE